MISAQVHYLQSFHSCKVQIGLGLMAWSTGASQQLISVLNQACLSKLYSSILSIIEALAKESLQQARQISCGPHSFGYDNINLSGSIHAEQSPNAPNKVISGTFGVIYQLLGGNSEHMKLAPIMQQLCNASPLKITDLHSSLEAMKAYHRQTLVNIIMILTKYILEFSHLQKHTELQYHSCCPLPSNHKTKFYPLRALTIEEASIKGNILVHNDVYLVQLQHDPAHLNDLMIPAIHDQLTNAQNQGAQAMCKKDSTPWTHHEIFQLGFGVFHLLMNFIWALLNTHCATVNQTGSLSRFFAVLEKICLSADHPDFHMLLTALTQILDGLIVNAWCDICGFPSLDELAKSNPTPSNILEFAGIIIQKYATPSPKAKPATKPLKSLNVGNDPDASDTDDENHDPPANGPPSAADPKDIIHKNVVRLTRDLLYMTELVKAVSDGDLGRVEDILLTLPAFFVLQDPTTIRQKSYIFCSISSRSGHPSFRMLVLLYILIIKLMLPTVIGILCMTICLSTSQACQGMLWGWI